MGDVDPACDASKPVKITIDDINTAKTMIESGIVYTPCLKSHLSKQLKMDLYLKKEFLQYTGSFKDRGARHTLLRLSAEQKTKGVVAASAGNHGISMSHHGQSLGIPVTIVMPIGASIMKIQKCKSAQANVILEGIDMTLAKAAALKMAHNQGLTYINGYDYPHVLAGAGTIGLEIIEQVPGLEAILVQVGGGGLIAGVAVAIKAKLPNVQIIGVESEKCASFTKSIEAGYPILTTCYKSLADGLAVPLVGYNAFETAKRLIDKLVVVKEELVALAILALLESEKCVVEGAGATSLAAIFAGALPELKGKKVAIILSGGNIDTTVLGRCLERGLAVMGRLLKFTVVIDDMPGCITGLLDKLTEIGICIKDIMHERAWVFSDMYKVKVKVICETRDIEHAIQLKELLDSSYEQVDFTYFPNVGTAKSIGI